MIETKEPQPFSEDIRQYAQILRRWIWLLLLFAGLAGVAGYFVSLQQPRIYEASATVLINQPQVTSDYTSILANEREAQTFSQLMVQELTLEGVIQELGLDIRAGDLRRSIQVQVVPDTKFLTISVEDTDPEQAAQIANTIGAVFADKMEELQASRYKETKASLEAQMESMNQQIEQTSQSLEKLEEVSETTVERSMLQAELAAYQDLYKTLLKDDLLSESGSESELDRESLKTQLETTTQRIEEITAQLGTLDGSSENDVERDILETELSGYQDLYGTLLQEYLLSEIETGSDPDGDSLSTQLESVAQRIQEITLQLGTLAGSSEDGGERDRLESNLALYRQTYANLVQSYEQIRLAEIQNTTTVDVVTSASPPSQPTRPDMLNNTLLSSIVGLMVGGGVVFLIETLDDTLRTPEDITRHLGLPVLGMIAAHSKDPDKLISMAQPRSPITESFRGLRTNIQFADIDHPPKVLLITSSVPGEGKTTVASNLGVVFAHSGQKTLILDTDFRRPQIHKQFGLHNRFGLSKLFMQARPSTNGVYQKTELDDLLVLTTGSIPPNPAELLGSKKMGDIIQSLREEANIVVIDSPPLTAASDAAVVAPQIDGVILVIKPGETKQMDAKRAVEQLRHVGAKIIGVVLNEIDIKRNRYYSSYFKSYYYQYDYGNWNSKGDGNAKRPKKSRRRIL
ncbi:MAG: polysaccharide biosynthesis tyrosine autokinase [Anaerolineales bacterium]|jgi:capsular exopolysaccharide synthesis family protein